MRDFSKVSWIWFDLDDTLIDFHLNSREANRIIYDEERLDRFYPTPEEWIGAYESHNRSLWERYGRGEITQAFLREDRFAALLRERWQKSPEELSEFSWHLDRIYLDRLASRKNLIAGARETLQLLKDRGYNIGVLSNGFQGVQQAKLINTGLGELVDLTVLSDDIGVNKPDIRLYRHAMERSGQLLPEHHAMIGDNLATDIAGAIGAGWGAILLDPHVQAVNDCGNYISTPCLTHLATLFKKPSGAKE